MEWNRLGENYGVSNLKSCRAVHVSHHTNGVSGMSGAVAVGYAPESVTGMYGNNAILALVGRGLVKCRISDPCEKECSENDGGECC